MQSRKQALKQALFLTLPICVGYLPYGIAYGVLARQVGLSLVETVSMSFIVYAGTAQIVAVGMLQASQSHSAIVLATLMINVRYLLLCASLAPRLKGWKRLEQLVFGYYVSDETFAILSTKLAAAARPKTMAFTVNTIALFGWVASSTLGFTLSHVIPNIETLGLDFVLPAVFIGLLFILMRGRKMALVALVAGSVSTLLHFSDVQGFAVLIATIVGATIGVVMEQWNSKRQLS